MSAEGRGLLYIAKKLNAEKIPSPTGRGWASTSIREMLRRELYRGEIVYGKTKWRRKGGEKKFKVKQVLAQEAGLDELPEFSTRVLEALRQPLEDARVVVSRSASAVVFPARFQLVAAANPCRRGCASLPTCACAPPERARYLGRLSRPLLDRIDLQGT